MKRVCGILMASFLLSCAHKNETYLTREPASFVKTSFLTEVKDASTFNALANAEPGGVIRTGAVMKFLIDNRAHKSDAPIYFINSNYCDKMGCPTKYVSLHRTWAEKHLKDFNYDLKTFSAMTYHSKTTKERDFFAGRIQTFEYEGRTFYGVWFVEMDQIHGEMIQFALNTIRKHFTVPNAELAFVSYGLQQSTAEIQDWLKAENIPVHQIGNLVADVDFMPLNTGEAWGFLRVFPEDPDDLEPSEIAVFSELPLDLAVVAGTITTGFQDISSHVNLKSKERGTPNMMIRDPQSIERIKRINGKPAHLVVREDGYLLEPTTAEIIQSKLQKKATGPWKGSTNDLGASIVHYDEMCKDRSSKRCLDLSARYGGKSSRLGFLAHKTVVGEESDIRKSFGYRLSPLGFAVPISYYKNFVDFNRKKNPTFDHNLQKLIDSEMGLNGATPLNVQDKKRLIADIKQDFLNASFPPGMYAELEKNILKMKADVAAKYPGEDLNKVKIRSSANVEDIENFNGAGLHDSFSAKIKKSSAAEADSACQIVTGSSQDEDTKEEVEPESIACAIKGVYASLWNLRAVRERTYRRFDHRESMMGLSFLPSYKFREMKPKINIVANSVLVTRVLNTTTVYGYQLSTQKGNNLVTNPDGSTIAELAVLAFQLTKAPSASIIRYAIPEKNQPALTTPVLTLEQMQNIVKIGRRIEERYCEEKKDYFPGGSCAAVSNSQRKPKALDMELKVYNNGEILFKQFREFSGK